MRGGNTRFAHNKDVARRARASAKTRFARLKAADGAHGQYLVRLNKDVARRARASAKTRSARIKAAGGAGGQYPVRP